MNLKISYRWIEKENAKSHKWWLLLWTLDKWTRYFVGLFINPICLGNISEANRTLEFEFLRSSGLCNSISLCIDKTWFTSPTSLKSRVAVDCQYFIQFFISFGFSWWGVCICRQERIKCNCFQVNLLNISNKCVAYSVPQTVWNTANGS